MKELLDTLETSDDVYGPREDSLLLAEAAAKHRGERMLDVGTGTGVVAAAAAKNFDEVVAVDVNPEAVRLARRNLPGATVIESDLFESVEDTFDLVTFNPPYLPTDDGTRGDPALDGGETGHDVIQRFVEGVPEHLSGEGAVLVLVSSLTGIGEVEGLLRDNDFSVERVASERHFFEELVVLKASQ